MTGAGAAGPGFEALFRAAGVTGWIHAADLDTGREVGHGSDEPQPTASMYKVPLLVELCRQADAGLLDPAERVTVPAAGRSQGPTGIAVMLDDVTISLRDLAYLMIAVSDNTAADTLLRRVGRDAVNAMLEAYGLGATRVRQSSAEINASMAADAGHGWPYLDPEEVARMRALDPARGNVSTAREMTRLFGLIWRDEIASAASCAWMRGVLNMQVWPHRLASGFPYDDVAVSGKTGTLPTLRTESGVVEYPDGGRYAVAVFTRSFATALNQPRADAVIGTAARMAVDHLRR
ncbi:class A beta-lactamase-related serine hydrolase [Actinomadura sp. ATCC 31491]|uniref:Class A beta-lactamase-related serine hydrolase n=1 Tax=Actinomadura luzonensis TaxID=2805427 RepID=A0ABT0G969_9ACTN|nr:serine hydrolase [Actinomadura luzonensis]MCK2221141.1 class A beta-lactamase-related serine hydrolase [Actinomadura luzonensis]